MSDGAAQMDAMITRVAALPGMVERSAPAVASALDGHLRRTIAAGTSADGAPWTPTADGRTPLRNAGKALTTRAVGTIVLARLDGIEARHHKGEVRGAAKGLKRRILPIGKLPKPVAAATQEILRDEFRRTVGGAR